jgi:hypothetical protein
MKGFIRHQHHTTRLDALNRIREINSLFAKAGKNDLTPDDCSRELAIIAKRIPSSGVTVRESKWEKRTAVSGKIHREVVTSRIRGISIMYDLPPVSQISELWFVRVPAFTDFVTVICLAFPFLQSV